MMIILLFTAAMSVGYAFETPNTHYIRHHQTYIQQPNIHFTGCDLGNLEGQ